MENLHIKYRRDYDNILKRLYQIFTYKNKLLLLQGSASLSNLKYSADYDLITPINLKQEPRPPLQNICKYINSIIDATKKNDDIYFIELKIQYKDGSKIKYNKNNLFKCEYLQHDYKKIDYVKIDVIVFYNSAFKEASLICKFDYEPIENDKYIELLQKDYEEYIKIGKYFKALKREFIILRLKKPVNNKKIVAYMKFFNSATGLKYKNASNLETILILLDNYNDGLTEERVKTNLINLGLKPNIDINYIEDQHKKLMQDVNLKAYNFMHQ